MRDNNKIFKCYENPSFINIHIQNRETLVKIAYADGKGLKFYIEFTFNGKSFKKVLGKISTKEKTFNSDEIEFEGIELHPLDKDKIAHCLNEILDFYFSN